MRRPQFTMDGLANGRPRIPIPQRRPEVLDHQTIRGTVFTCRSAPISACTAARDDGEDIDDGDLMVMDLLPLAASNLDAARSQMAFTLGFHIILACLVWRCPRSC